MPEAATASPTGGTAGSARDRALRVLHLVPDQDVRFPLLENLVHGLSRQGLEQTVCYLRGSSAATVDRLRGSAEVVGLGLDARRLRRLRPSVAMRLAGVLRERAIDIVHCQRHKATIYGVLAATLAGPSVRVVSTVHGRGRTRSFRRRQVNRVTFSRISRIIAVSEAVRRDVLETNPACPPDKVVTVYNGIDADRFGPAAGSRDGARRELGLPADPFVAVSVGRLTEVKGHVGLIAAFAAAARERPDGVLVLCGDGPLRGALERQADELGIAGRVLLLGQRDDVPLVLRAADVFVLPSRSEGHPLALLEAMACERPVISTRVGGVPEILGPGDGITVEPGDEAAMAAALGELWDAAPERRAAVGARLRRIVLDRFTVEQMVEATARTYRACRPARGAAEGVER